MSLAQYKSEEGFPDNKLLLNFKNWMIKTEIATNSLVFRHCKEFYTDFIRIIYRLSTDYMQVL